MGNPTSAPIANVLEVSNISKSFPGVRALKSVSFDVRRGEIHALMGENGAGKSTLMKILAGNQTADSGEIRHLGELVKLTTPLEAKKRGILLIHQEISLVPELSVMENIFLGSFPTKSFGRVDRRRLRTMAQEILTTAGYDISPDEIVGDLPLAKQQLVEIARALAFKCSVVIFDEPTASLSAAEAETLFTNIGRLSKQGVAIVYISHRMKEIFRLSDRVTVLRDGESQATLETGTTNQDEVTQLMIGRPVSGYLRRPNPPTGAAVISVSGLSVPGFIQGASFSIRAGEVLGLYGLVGSGRSELAEALFGLRSKSAGQIKWKGEPVEIRSAQDAVRLGIGFVPEDRKLQGLVLGLGGRDNIVLPILSKLSTLGFSNHRAERSLYDEYKAGLSIKAASSSVLVGTLSGGNQQKIVLSKWLASKPEFLILDEPTRGVDVGAKAELHELVGKLAEEGLAILLISSEMPEIMGLSHRIITIANGRTSGEYAADVVTEDQLVGSVMHVAPR